MTQGGGGLVHGAGPCRTRDLRGHTVAGDLVAVQRMTALHGFRVRPSRLVTGAVTA